MATATTAPLGLTTAEVDERRRAGLANDTALPTSRPLWVIVRANVFTRFNAILGVLMAVIIVVGPFQDSLFAIVLVLNTLIGIGQELRAKRTLDRLALLTTPTVRAWRDGSPTVVALQDLVVDDVVELSRGDQVPLDGVVLPAGRPAPDAPAPDRAPAPDGAPAPASAPAPDRAPAPNRPPAPARDAVAVAVADATDDGDLELDESLLTGESEPVPVHPGDEVRSGSFVSAGSGRYRVTRAGRDSFAQSLASEARRFAPARSELVDGVNQILRLVQWALLPTGTALVVSQLVSH